MKERASNTAFYIIMELEEQQMYKPLMVVQIEAREGLALISKVIKCPQ